MVTKRALLVDAGLIVAAAVASIALALLTTPMQQVHAVGQTIQVGGAPSWSFSGPGELDLFGQKLPTTIDFVGPVRPRIRLTHITLSQQVAEFGKTDSLGDASRALEDALVSGWHRYFYWEIGIVGAAALLLLGAASGWLRRSRRRTLALIAVGLAVAEAINLGIIMFTAYTAPRKLSQVTSLQALVGGSPIPAVPPSGTALQPGSKVVVIGDSTAAGKGNPVAPNATAAGRACDRSPASYASALARANQWQVTNLACSGATITDGLLGPQRAESLTVPAQMDNPAVADASMIIVSIGANDVRWTNILLLCAVSSSCDNNAERAYFQQQLGRFSQDYLQLLTRLQTLPKHPRVLVNQYYAPLSDSDRCLESTGIDADKRKSLLSHLDVLNTILAKGAETAEFLTVKPDFDGHGPCSAQPYVQGLDSAAPFHPTPAGELAIALADERALQPADDQGP